MNPLVNNWTYGETSPKLGGRFDLPIYSQGCEVLLNFKPMLQGGITRRPPLTHVAKTIAGKLIPFTLSSGQSFLIELSEKKLRIWEETLGSLSPVTFMATGNDYLSTDYSASEIWQVQYAQYYDRIYFAHKNHHQAILLYSGNAFGFSPFLVTCDNDNSFGQSTDNYPSVVAICQNRLWYASTNAKPYTIWASRPPYDGAENHNLLTTFDTVVTETEVLKDASKWPTTTDDNGNTTYDFSDTSKFIETKEESEDVISAKCGMELELASGRNDRIVWISGMNDIIVGTEASEWLLPYDIDPTKQSASMQSSYGSIALQPETMHDGIFYIQRGNRLREFIRTSDGTASNDLSFTADHLLSVGVRQIVCMRNPEPIVFLLLNDGTLVVLCYDKANGVQGWARWTTEGTFISIATRENEVGQELYATVKRGGSYYLERFDFDERQDFKDRSGESEYGNLQYQSLMVGNRFDFQSDSGTSIGHSKKVKEVWVRCLDSGRLSTGVDEAYMQETKNAIGNEDYRIPISGGSRKELRMRIESVESDPLTLLAMTFELEVR